jgi:hypothetical protein
LRPYTIIMVDNTITTLTVLAGISYIFYLRKRQTEYKDKIAHLEHNLSEQARLTNEYRVMYELANSDNIMWPPYDV